MALYPASIIDSDSIASGRYAFYPGMPGIYRRFFGTARITSTVATSFPVFVRGNKLGEQDVPLTLPAVGTAPGSLLTITQACFWYPSKITLPTSYTATNGNELICTSGELLALTSANVLTGSAATVSLTTSTISFSGTNTVTAADVGLLKYALIDPYRNADVVNANLITSVHTGAVSIRNLTAAGNLQTLGTGVSLNPAQIPTGFGRDNAFISIPVFIEALCVPQTTDFSDYMDLSVSGLPY
jgi:hypothetical protein